MPAEGGPDARRRRHSPRLQNYDLAGSGLLAALRALLLEHLSTVEREALQRTARLASAAEEAATTPAPTPKFCPLAT